jgi:lysozyme family protein
MHHSLQLSVEVIRELQRVVHVEPDGIVGDQTVTAIQVRNHWDVAALFMGRRGLRYAYQSEAQYRGGLMARLFRVHRAVILLNGLVEG